MQSVGRGRRELYEDPGATYRSQFRIGGVSVRVGGQNNVDASLPPSLDPFRTATRISDIDIQVEWSEKLDPAAGRQLFDSNSVWRLYADGAELQFDFSAAILGEEPYKRLHVDSQFRTARLQMSTGCFTRTGPGVTPLEYPLDELLIIHRLTQEKAIELHSCGIVRADGTGNLFVGHSGAGKSTTTRLWTAREDVEVLSDDRIIVRRDEVRREMDEPGAEPPCAGADSGEGKGILRLRDCSASRTSQPVQDAREKKGFKMRMYGTPWHGEAAYASPESAPLARIFILEHGHGNVLTRLSPSRAVAELFARSFVPFHRHEYVDSALEFLQELVGAVPCYHYSFEPDYRAVDTILNFHD
jgi:hypothetical protein